MIGLAGALAGFVLGYLLCLALGSIEIKNPFIDTDRLPLAYTHAALSASPGRWRWSRRSPPAIMPARKAARVHPVDIIRGAT